MQTLKYVTGSRISTKILMKMTINQEPRFGILQSADLTHCKPTPHLKIMLTTPLTTLRMKMTAGSEPEIRWTPQRLHTIHPSKLFVVHLCGGLSVGLQALPMDWFLNHQVVQKDLFPEILAIKSGAIPPHTKTLDLAQAISLPNLANRQSQETKTRRTRRGRSLRPGLPPRKSF